MKNIKQRLFNITALKIAGTVLIFLLAALLLWHGNANSRQAVSALVAEVTFHGEYRIGDGEWHDIVEGEHISSTKGDVTLRGNFHMYAPDGEYVGVYRGEIPVALYLNHISLTVFEGEELMGMVDTENPIFGDSACCEEWVAYTLMSESEEDVEMRVHNPHVFGNENAIDELLSDVALWTSIDFEKGILEAGEAQRTVGILFATVSLMLLGTALFVSLIHIQNSKIIWTLGIVILFAGAYLAYSVEGVSFWSDSTVSNTTILGASMMLYMMFLSMAIVHFLGVTKKVGTVVVFAIGAFNAVMLLLPVISDIRFYDTWLWWAIAQVVANTVLLACLVREICSKKGKVRWLYVALVLPLVSFDVDVLMTGLGVWEGGVASKYVFIVFFIIAMIVVLKIIPHSINTIAKAKELETEMIVLNAKLTETKVSTMMSQIRPHFIYNTLGSIEQLCKLDPPKAGELVHNFAKYLRGSFGELDNPKPILMSQEMDHVYHYVNIESVRFPDMTFSFEMKSGDFNIPALTIQPIVENAVKHGLMMLPRGGTIRVVSYETDTHYCVSVEDDGIGFDTSELLNEKRNHVGIRNIRGRLEAMVDGTLEIESTVGEGTKVLISIPKEVQK